MPGATVRIDGKEVGLVQPDGTFKHEGSPGLHTIELEKAGYLTVSGNVELTLGSTTTFNVTMHPDTSAAEMADAADYAAVADSTDPSALLQYLRKYSNSKRTP